MPEYTVFNLATQVEGMRNAQNLYFIQSGKAKKTKSPEDFAEAKRILAISKHLEKAVDDTLRDISDAGKDKSRVLIDIETYQERIDRENDLTTEREAFIKVSKSRLHLFEQAADCVKILEDLDEIISDDERLYPHLVAELTVWRKEVAP